MPKRKMSTAEPVPALEYKDRCRIADAGCIIASMPMPDPYNMELCLKVPIFA
jgi:hypothetical protein